MKQRLALGLSLLFALNGYTPAQADGARYKAADGMFSFSIPSGWTLQEVPGRKYKSVFGRTNRGFAPSMNIVDESFSGPLADYVDSNLKVVPQLYAILNYRNFKVLNRELFSTSAGQTGVRVITRSELNGRALRQTFYFFDGKVGRKLVITCTALADGGEEYDLMFEKSMKSFRSEASSGDSISNVLDH